MSNIFIYRVEYKTQSSEKTLRINFDNVYEYIEKDGWNNYLILIPLNKKYEQMFEKNKTLVQKKVIIQMFIITTTWKSRMNQMMIFL